MMAAQGAKATKRKNMIETGTNNKIGIYNIKN